MAPDPDFKWSQLDGLSETFYQHCELAPPQNLINRYDILLDEATQLVACLTASQLFESRQRL